MAIDDDAKAILRVHGERLGPVTEIVAYLNAMDDAYNHLYAFHLSIAEVKARSEPRTLWYGRSPSARLRVIQRPRDVVLGSDRLRLLAISIQSPGSWDFLGSLNPLETLRKYLADRHERLKDRDYRNKSERERLGLENARLQLEVARQEVDLLREVGVPEDRIRTALLKHVERPLATLDSMQDKGIIESAELLESPKKGDPD